MPENDIYRAEKGGGRKLVFLSLEKKTLFLSPQRDVISSKNRNFLSTVRLENFVRLMNFIFKGGEKRIGRMRRN